jgi:hypothetical protein
MPPELKPEKCPKCRTAVINATGIGPFCPNVNCDVSDNLLQVKHAPAPTRAGDKYEIPSLEELQNDPHASLFWSFKRLKRLVSLAAPAIIISNEFDLLENRIRTALAQRGEVDGPTQLELQMERQITKAIKIYEEDGDADHMFKILTGELK